MNVSLPLISRYHSWKVKTIGTFIVIVKSNHLRVATDIWIKHVSLQWSDI